MDEAMARAAREEFQKFVRWFNEKVGIHPIIIGGWAVDYYNDYYGSKDIDVVFQGTRDVYERPLLQFLKTNGYVLAKHDTFTETFKKKFVVGGRAIEIDIDATDTGSPNQFHADGAKSLPYSLCTKYPVEVSDEGASFRVPRLELLLALKMKAYHDRNFEIIQPETARQGLVEYYTSKRDKDGSDIIALLDGRISKHAINIDDLFMRALVKKYNFDLQAREVVSMIQDRPGSRDLYKRIGDANRLALLSKFSARIFK